MSCQNLVFCSYTVKRTVLFYSIYGALAAAQGGICKCADCRIYNIYVQFGRLTLICIHCAINCEDTLA